MRQSRAIASHTPAMAEWAMSNLLCALPLIASLLSACPEPSQGLSGYVEGEYVSLAPLSSGRIVELRVHKGQIITKGAVLAQLETQDAEYSLAEAKARLSAAEATAQGARLELARVRELTGQNVTAQANFDSAKAALDVAEAQVRAAQAGLAQAQWQLDEKSLKAPEAGIIDDVLRHVGDMAGPSQPVISWLPQGAVKLKLYAPEALRNLLSPGARLNITCDNCPDNLQAEISFIAKEPEFTPPVIYSVNRRQKLVYLIEARPIDTTQHLYPGMIVDASAAHSKQDP